MALPLNYQISEFDCGPTSLLNALSHQFDRKLIQPCLIKAVYNYTLDSCDARSHPGNRGTSSAALHFIGEWMNEYGEKCGFPIRCESLAPQDVWLGEGSPLNAALENGAAAVVRCFLCVGHYVVLTGLRDQTVELWDPYYVEKPFRRRTIQMVTDEPCHCNRRVDFDWMNSEGKCYYNLGEISKRECLLVYNTAAGAPAECLRP